MSVNSKIDRLLEDMSAMRPMVEASHKRLEELDKRLNAVIVNDAVQEQKIAAVHGFCDGVNKKIVKHVEGHWKWVSVAFGLVILASAVMKYFA